MRDHAEAERFEAAATLRDSVRAVERTLTRQDVVQEEAIDQDVWGLHREADRVDVVVLFVRGGKLVGRRAFVQRDQELPSAHVLAEHLQRYYDTGTFVPDEVVAGVDLDDAELSAEVLSEWLTDLRGARRKHVRVIEPRRGTRARLVELAARNAKAVAASRTGQADDADALLGKLQARLGLARLPQRIECFDVAHTQGSEPVASMVTFERGAPAKARYRRFNVKTVANDDFAAMYEVLTRRLARGKDAAAGSPWALPDLLVVDGGKGQLGMAMAAIADLGLTGALDVIGLAKERELTSRDAPDRVYLPNQKDAVELRANSAELFVLARIRDEAHRFANTSHKARRSRAVVRSALDDVPGVGPKRRTALLRHFGSVRAIRAASVEELARAPGMTKASAAAVAAFLGGSDDNVNVNDNVKDNDNDNDDPAVDVDAVVDVDGAVDVVRHR
jgi:excinuclease ABC subunit C